MIIYILCIFALVSDFYNAKEVPTKMEKLFDFAEEVLSGPDIDSLSCAAKKDIAEKPNKIVGGNLAHFAPYHAFYLIWMKKKNFHYGCGGTILNKRYILTVKHCFFVDPITPEIASIKAIVGELNWCRAVGLDITDILFNANTSFLAPIFEEKFENVKEVSEVIFHGNASEAHYKDDLALLKVSSSFVLIPRE